MEYLIVRFVRDRSVIVDGVVHGRTGDVIELAEGVYNITLEGPRDFTPDSIQVTVLNSSRIAPMELSFQPLEEGGGSEEWPGDGRKPAG